MSQTNSSTFTPSQQRGQHLKFDDSCSLKIFKKLNFSLRHIASELDCSPSTVLNELRRGTVSVMNALPRKQLEYATPKELFDSFLDVVYSNAENSAT